MDIHPDHNSKYRSFKLQVVMDIKREEEFVFNIIFY
ncbi:hypothetical protein CDLVIII_4291 [Clostridium sp. DL-VIII]|nr:hypothetical protein CDLVIII_4291 [Clostridium sp. DL-VIII]